MDEAASGAAGGGGDDGAVAILSHKTNVATRVNVGQPVTDVCCRIENERQRFFLIFPSNAVVSEYLLKQT